MKPLLYCPRCQKEFNDIRTLNSHLKKYLECLVEFNNYLSENFIEGIDYVICKECGNIGIDLSGHVRVHRMSIKDYVKKYPGSIYVAAIAKEKSKQTCLEKYGAEHTLQVKKIREKGKRTCLEKYGTDNYSNTEEYKERVKSTCLEKYGVDNYSKTEECKEKIKQTCLEKYGSEYYLQTEKFKEKSKQTCLEKYNVEYASQSAEVREKVKETNLSRYDVECIFQNEECKEKIKQTCLEKYGVEYISQAVEHQEKIKQINLERYGVEYIFQSEEIKDKIKQACLERYGVDNYSKTEEYKEKFQKTCLERYGVKHSSQSEEIKDKIKQTCLERYGVEYTLMSPEVHLKGKQTHFERYGDYSNMVPTFSLNSQLFFCQVEHVLREIYHDNLVIHYATNGESCEKTNEYQVLIFNNGVYKGVRFLDFYVKGLNRWIEFDEGYHDSEEQNILDCDRESEIFNNIEGIELLRIKESEFLANEEQTLFRAIHFLTDSSY
ncbi:MAG: hypothetical protein PHQ89_05800 [Bacilli bacterium]|nr:hypothetical protein [Bacilli bacterium]